MVNLNFSLTNSPINDSKSNTNRLTLKKSSKEWICSMCFITNPNSLGVCEACETPRYPSEKDSHETQSTKEITPKSLIFQPGFFKSTNNPSTSQNLFFGTSSLNQNTETITTSAFIKDFKTTSNTCSNETACLKNNFCISSQDTSKINEKNIFAASKFYEIPLKTGETDLPVLKESISQQPSLCSTMASSSSLSESSTHFGSFKRSRFHLDTTNIQNFGSPASKKRTRPCDTPVQKVGDSQLLSDSQYGSSPTQKKTIVDGFFANLMESPQYIPDYKRRTFDDEIVSTPLRVDPINKPLSPLRDSKSLSTNALNLLQPDSENSKCVKDSLNKPVVTERVNSIQLCENNQASEGYRFSFGVFADESSSVQNKSINSRLSHSLEPCTPDTQTPSIATPNFGSVAPDTIVQMTLNCRGSLDLTNSSNSLIDVKDSSTTLRSSFLEEDAINEKYSLNENNNNTQNCGIVFTWGSGECDQLALADRYFNEFLAVPSPCCIVKLRKQKVTQIVCGALHTLALLEDGSVVSWGCNDDLVLGREPNTLPEKQPVRIQHLPENDPIVAISCGDCHSAAITSLGKCFIWGCYKDSSGYIGFPDFQSVGFSTQKKKTYIPTLVEGIQGTCVRVCSGENHTGVLCLANDALNEPFVYLWGSAEFGQLCIERSSKMSRESLLFPQLQTATKLQLPGIITNLFMGLATTFFEVQKEDVTYYGVGRNCCGELVLFLLQIRDITSCQFASIALTSNGDVLTWGKSDQLGRSTNGKMLDRKPSTVEFFKENVRCIGKGGDTMFAVTKKGVLYAWGEGQTYQIGDGKEYENSVLSPCLVSPKHFDGKAVLAACGGSQHSVALVFNGESLIASDDSIPAWVTELREGTLSRFVYSNYIEHKNVLKKRLVEHEVINSESQIKEEEELVSKEHNDLKKNDNYVPQRITRASLRKKINKEEVVSPKEKNKILKKKPSPKALKIKKEKKMTSRPTQNKLESVNNKPVKRVATVRKKVQPTKQVKKETAGKTEISKKTVTKAEISKEAFLTDQLQEVRKQPSRSSKKRQATTVTKESVEKNSVVTAKPTLSSSSSSVQKKKTATLSLSKLVDMEPTRKLPPRKARH
ncbi:uncharacterized protein LOC128883423 isoform X2 [Hylaeus volcanicus]|uniref:uncharacterized protein LOC128883423 isoform X2 n=1 Tax=Hylaeus volcanicus TaxID=313075 RepID=UPI0023B87C4B|nr:uncharacterized protein LOC128883423 isoform X2 [Hylaeus volcanicus]